MMTHGENGRKYPHVLYASHSPSLTFCLPQPLQWRFVVAKKGGNEEKKYVPLGNPNLDIEPARGPFPDRTHLILKIIQMLKTVVCQTRFHRTKMHVKPRLADVKVTISITSSLCHWLISYVHRMTKCWVRMGNTCGTFKEDGGSKSLTGKRPSSLWAFVHWGECINLKSGIDMLLPRPCQFITVILYITIIRV